jgi:hypothetical protein
LCEMCEIPIDLPLQRQKNALAGADAKRNVGHPMELWQGCLEPVTRISKLTAAQPLQIEHIGELSDFAKAKREGST